jgi:hypothetical protein
MDTSTTLLHAKSAFILSQVRLLTSPLSPSTTWSSFAPPTTESPFPAKAIDTAISRLNEKLKKHNKNVYSAPSQRHVAEQLDALYWNQVLEEDGEADLDALAISRDADLTSSEVIEGLPEQLQDLQIHRTDQTPSDAETTRYAILRKRLLDAARRRDTQKKRMEGYRALQEVLEPLEGSRENVQPNLVTRDGELGRELDRMRVLCARVASGVGEVQGEEKGLGEGVGERERLKGALDLT